MRRNRLRRKLSANAGRGAFTKRFGKTRRQTAQHAGRDGPHKTLPMLRSLAKPAAERAKAKAKELLKVKAVQPAKGQRSVKQKEPEAKAASLHHRHRRKEHKKKSQEQRTKNKVTHKSCATVLRPLAVSSGAERGARGATESANHRSATPASRKVCLAKGGGPAPQGRQENASLREGRGGA